MYSLVLMTALSTAPATPQFDGYFRDLFRGGCQGGSCVGRDSRSGCQGGCTGCRGGLFDGRIRNFFADLFDPPRRSCHGSCHGGCQGSCVGRGYDRYAGGCTGCVGSQPLYLGSCFGSTPNSSCFGTSCTGGIPLGVPLPPGDFAAPQPVGFGVGGCDCVTGGGVGIPPLGTPLPGGTYPTIPSPGVPMVPPTMPDDGFGTPAQPRPAEGRGGVAFKTPLEDDAASRGTVAVKLPADARLFVEGRQLTVKDGQRTFVTPPLPADREAVYTFRAEYTRDGETLSQTKKVRVRAGGYARVEFADLSQSAKADPPKELPSVPTVPTETTKLPVQPSAEGNTPRPPSFNAQTTTKPAADEVPTLKPPPGLDVAKITVKLPAGATLYVNGGRNPRTEAVREFTTPILTPGKAYTYTMRAEITRNGLPEYQESKVEFRAGDALTVDFTSLGQTKAAK